MPIEDLLAQVAEEHRVLQSKYGEALLEIDSLRIRCSAVQPPEFEIRSFEDSEAASTQRRMLCESLHRTPPAADMPIPAEPSTPAADRPMWAEPPTSYSTVLAPSHARKSLKAALELKFSSFDSCGSAKSMISKHSNDLPLSKLRRSRMSTSNESVKSYLSVGGSRSEAGNFNTNYLDFEGDQSRERVASILRHPALESVLISVVIANIAVLWLETDRRAQELPRGHWSQILNHVFLVIYATEFCLRAYAYRARVFQDRWNTLDLIVITVDMASLLLEAIVGDFLLGGVNASIFRLLRVFRLLRLFKVLRFVIELQLLVHGFFGAMRAQLFAGLMLEIVVLLWSFLFVEVVHPHVIEMSEAGFFEDCVRCTKAYSSMFEAHMTIWQQVIAGDSWGSITLDVVSNHPETSIVFLGCLMTIQFAMLNLIFTVIVDAAARAREDDDQQKLIEKEMSFHKLKQKLVEMCRSLDKDNTGELSLEELIEGYAENAMFADTMATLDITAQDLTTVFMIMDEDRSGSVSYIEFVNNLYKIKEQDHNTLLMFIKGYVVDLRYHVQEILGNMMSEMHQQLVENTARMQTMMGHIETSSSHIESLLTRGDGEDNQVPHQRKTCPTTNTAKNDKRGLVCFVDKQQATLDRYSGSTASWSQDSISDALSAVLANLHLIRKDLNAHFGCVQPRVEDVGKVSSEIADKGNKLGTDGVVSSSVDPASFAVIPEKAERWRILEVPVRPCV